MLISTLIVSGAIISVITTNILSLCSLLSLDTTVTVYFPGAVATLSTIASDDSAGIESENDLSVASSGAMTT